MANRALITGVTGFVGSHLAEYLLSKGYEVYGTKRHQSRLDNIEHIKDKITLVDIDITDRSSVINALKKTKPDFIFHLAAQSYVPAALNAPESTMATNVIGTLNILEAVRILEIDPVMHVAGSSEEYGKVFEDEMPITEKNILRPMSPYAVSKATQDLLAIQYASSYKLKVIVTRAFNHTGPRQREVFVCSDFARQVALIEKGKQEPVIRHGNLEAQRDFSDVRDIAKAYELAVLKCKPGEVYNICSEKSTKIMDILNILVKMSKKKIETEVDKNRFRPIDIKIFLGNCSKFKKLTAWKPEIEIEQTLKDLLDYWRGQV